jgi:hypothetical protein
LAGTLKRWGLSGWIKRPLISWGLLSHKILRWLTPYFMLLSFIFNFALLSEGILFYNVIMFLQVLFYFLVLIGFVGEFLNKRIRIALTVSDFIVANIGMAIGVIMGLIGKAPARY